jgi:hypothetical protein
MPKLLTNISYIGTIKLSKPASKVGCFHKKEKIMQDIDLKQLAQAVRAIAEEKNLPEDVVHAIIEQAIAAAWRRDNGDRDQEVRAEMDQNSGEVAIYVSREVVEVVGADAVEISLDDAKKIKTDAVIGDFVEELADHPKTFGRVAAQTAKQVVLKIKSALLLTVPCNVLNSVLCELI